MIIAYNIWKLFKIIFMFEYVDETKSPVKSN